MSFDDVLLTILPPLLLVALMFLIGHRARMRDRRECDEWWRNFRERERLDDLRHAWRANFRRRANESEDAFVARFREWLYGEALTDADGSAKHRV